VIVSDLDVISVILPPFEADSVLVVDSDAVLSLPVAMQFLEPVSRRNSQVVERLGRIEHRQLSFRYIRRRGTFRSSGVPDFCCVPVRESLDHIQPRSTLKLNEYR